VVNELAQGRERTLLDIGCGPAALMHLVTPNIRYHGIDISIPDPAPNLMEADILKGPISFEGKRFDIVVAQGLFEYLGGYQDEKLSDIARLLEKDGTLVISYVNFGHRRPELYWPYNNIQPIDEFRRSLLHYFRVDACFPTSHNWRHSEPNRSFIAAINMRFNVTIPFVTPKLAVEFFFLCSPLDPKVSPIRN
jgi:SAM-dependent methyltransferase